MNKIIKNCLILTQPNSFWHLTISSLYNHTLRNSTKAPKYKNQISNNQKPINLKSFFHIILMNNIHFFPLNNRITHSISQSSKNKSISSSLNTTNLLSNIPTSINTIKMPSIINIKSMLTNRGTQQPIFITPHQTKRHSRRIQSQTFVPCKQHTAHAFCRLADHLDLV